MYDQKINLLYSSLYCTIRHVHIISNRFNTQQSFSYYISRPASPHLFRAG